ncbi:MAG: Fic family protein [Chloroflexi bacterium]|nr:Fic family protein [Chloroflexota bacterium]
MRGTYVRKTWTHDPTLFAPKRYRRDCSYDAFIPDPISRIEIRISGNLAAAISEAETEISGLNTGQAGHLAPLARLLLRTESIDSSRVEGLQVDTRSLARAEIKLETGKAVGPQAIEVLANIDAMELAVERAADARAIEVGDLRDIHQALLNRVSPKIAGRERIVQNWIGGNDYNPCGAAFVPPPPELLEELLADLCAFCNEDALSPLVQAAIAHAQFETIHPFEDGNGRTGRALVQVILRRTGLAPTFVPPISVMLARHKDTYIRGLTLFREGDLEGWLGTFADAAGSGAHLAQRYLKRVIALQQTWRDQLRALASAPRADAAAWAIIDMLPGHPVMTTSIAMAATGRTRPAIVNAVEQLVEARVLTPLSESRSNKAWEPAGLLDLIMGLEEGTSI